MRKKRGQKSRCNASLSNIVGDISNLGITMADRFPLRNPNLGKFSSYQGSHGECKSKLSSKARFKRR